MKHRHSSPQSSAPGNDAAGTGADHNYDPHPLFNRIFWAYGFRPFFVLSPVYAAISVLAWAGFWLGWIGLPEAIPAAEWHAHEMIYGFAGAALCGFLLTAVPEWTLTVPKTGRWLALLVALWLAGRTAMWLGDVIPIWVAAIINLALLPLLMLWTIPPLWAEASKRHRSIVLILPALWLTQLVTFIGWMGLLDQMGWGEDIAMRALNGGLHVFLIAVVLVFTRITMVLVPLALDEQGDKKSQFRPLPPRRNLAVAMLIFFALADFIVPDNPITGWIALAAAAAQLDRMADWHVGRVLLKPYMLTVYMAYAWLAAGLAGLGFNALFAWDMFAASRHALSLGAASTAVMAVFLIAGLRHTGRDVIIPRLCVLAVVMISLATALRTIGPTLFPDSYLALGIGAASIIWAGAFALYHFSFTTLLLRPRADGKPG